jgi:TonB-linked outer membrane protein, SusC/RagA family/TonB-dependent outer membrane receptor, SusC/RagA subfamily, signature region
LVDGTSTGTTTGADGSFVLSAPANGTLSISFIGYAPQQVAINKRSFIGVTLKEDATAIDDVVIEAFGEIRKKDFTGSISAVSAKELSKVTVSSATRMLEGAVAGVQTYSASGQPGSDANIIIRGVGSINAGQTALIVLDGVPYSSALSTINPLDIESLVISKDASANALYGSRAANGVVFVTTKKGNRNQKVNIMFEAKWGWNEQGVGEHTTMQNAGDYYEYTWNGLYNYFEKNNPGFPAATLANAANANLMPRVGNYMAYKIPEGTTLIDPATGKLNKDAKLLYHDNYDDYVFSKEFRQEYTLSISGGNEKMDYYVSGSFLDDPSYVIMSSFKRYSGRASFNAQATSWLKLGTNVSFTRRDTDAPAFGGANTGNIFTWTMWQNPTVPYYARDLEGNIRRNPDGSKMYEMGNGTTLSPYGVTSDALNSLNKAHPVQSMSRNIDNTIRDNVYAHFYGEVTFLKDFRFRANFTLDNVYRLSTFYRNNEYGGASIPTTNGTVEKQSNNYFSYNTQQTLMWAKTLNEKHHLDVTLSHEFTKTNTSNVAAYKKNIFYPGIPELGNAVTQNGNGSTSSTVITTIEGYVGRVNYNFDDRYFFSGSYRYDGSSRFKYDKWGHFWSVGFGWNIHNEAFMNNAEWVDQLKFRASYGVAGNQMPDNYPYTNLWTIAESSGEIGISQTYVGNPALSWERNKQVDLGIDFRLWDRFYGSIDYYNRRTHDLIWRRPTPSSSGLANRLENVGILCNRGFEFELGVEIFKRRDLYWNIGINASFQRDRLIDFPSELGNPALGGNYVTGAFLRGKGKPYRNLYLFKYAGVDPETGNETFWKDVEGADGKITREKTFDINDATQYEIGDAMPDVVGGFRTSFRWKNIDLMVAAAYQIGGRQWDGVSANLYDPGRAKFTVSQDLVGNTWTPENPNAKFPKLMANGDWNFVSALSDALYRKASYFSLKTVNVGYTLPQRWTSKIGIESLRIFFAADNLYFTSKHSGFDPRTDYVGQDGFGFPQAKTFTFGITINL